ncbi:MAG: hypothetical protein A6F70_02095 [Cycloclasticus sp. symbiont of Bathymodiolus heckerae]|nr:MAG: hypothetical protein A6F70_02095 [Cycloclasticus sp. symbiont of Bathymodiolus heckerae]
MENKNILEGEGISVTETHIIVNKKKTLISDIDSVFIGEQNPAKSRGFALIAIGVVLIVFTGRWFYAGGFLAVLAGIVSFFDSRRKYTVFLKKQQRCSRCC